MKLYKYLTIGGFLLASGLTSCVGDLNIEPQDETKKTELNTRDEYLGELAEAYYGLVKEGGITTGATGGEAVYTRMLFYLQDVCTDECIIAGNWIDAGVSDLVYAIPNNDNHWIYDMYSRINAFIAVCNQFIKDINGAGEFFSDAEIEEMKAEVRVLRDLGYYHMIDLFGRGPWTDENSTVGATPPTYDRTQLFETVVENIKNNVDKIPAAAQQEYGRISREAGYALLAKLYLNAVVYTGSDSYNGQNTWELCAKACQEVINGGLTLCPNYKYLFCASNERRVACKENGANQEIIWTVPQNDITLQCWGGTTTLSAGAYASAAFDSEVPHSKEIRKQLGFSAGPWDGIHMRPETVNNFTDPDDQRAMFYSGYDGDPLFVNDVKNLESWGKTPYVDNDGLMCIKYTYTDEDDYYNEAGVMSANDFNSAGTPIFRLGDIYLMMAECAMNGGFDQTQGLNYYKEVQKRAGISESNLATALPTKRQLLDERNRELYWEAQRRSDMIRLGYYTGGEYLWKWKGGVYEGTPIPEYRNLMPIPPQFVSTLGQNPGY